MARPQPADCDEVARVALAGISDGLDVTDVLASLVEPVGDDSIGAGECLLELAAAAVLLTGASADDRLLYSGIRERYLPEVEFRGRYQHHKSHFALRAAVLIAAGVDPAVEDEIRFWSQFDLHVWAVYALIVYVRAAADRTGRSPAEVCAAISASRSA